jgi:hypothetical protein
MEEAKTLQHTPSGVYATAARAFIVAAVPVFVSQRSIGIRRTAYVQFCEKTILCTIHNLGQDNLSKSITESVIVASSEQSALFCTEVLEAKRNTWLGDVVLIRPISFAFLTTVVATITAVMLIYSFGASTLAKLGPPATSPLHRG